MLAALNQTQVSFFCPTQLHPISWSCLWPKRSHTQSDLVPSIQSKIGIKIWGEMTSRRGGIAEMGQISRPFWWALIKDPENWAPIEIIFNDAKKHSVAASIIFHFLWPKMWKLASLLISGKDRKKLFCKWNINPEFYSEAPQNLADNLKQSSRILCFLPKIHFDKLSLSCSFVVTEWFWIILSGQFLWEWQPTSWINCC